MRPFSYGMMFVDNLENKGYPHVNSIEIHRYILYGIVSSLRYVDINVDMWITSVDKLFVNCL